MRKSNQFLHQLIWDLRAVKWGAMCVLILGALFVFVESQEFRQRMEANQLSEVIWWLMMFVAAITIVLNVVKDPAVGDRAFWFTRPIGFAKMWAAKFFVVLMFIAILGLFSVLGPVLSNGSEAIWPYASDYLLVYGAVIAVVFLGAICSRSVSRFLILLAVAAVVNIGLAFGLKLLNVYPSGSFIPVFGSLMLVSGLLVPIVGYAIRDTKFVYMLAFSVAVFAVLLSYFCRVDVENKDMATTQKQEDGWDKVELQLTLTPEDIKYRSKDSSYSSTNSGDYRNIASSAMVFGLHSNLVVDQIFLSGSILKDGESIWSNLGQPPIFSAAPYWIPQNILPGYTNATFRSVGPNFTGVQSSRKEFRLPSITIAKVSKENLPSLYAESLLSYQGSARVEGCKVRKLLSVPFGESQIVTNDGVSVKLEFSNSGGSRNLVNIRRIAWKHSGLQSRDIRVLVVNPKRKEVCQLKRSGGGGGPGFRFYYFRQRYMLWPADFDKPEIRQWFEDAELHIYYAESQGFFDVPVELKDFRFQDITGPLEYAD